MKAFQLNVNKAGERDRQKHIFVIILIISLYFSECLWNKNKDFLKHKSTF